MKKLVFTLMICSAVSLAFGQAVSDKVIRDYVSNHKDLAIQEMEAYTIPASITLAQGLLESGAGLSRLAREGNNHFGIKCHVGWKGKTMYHDDDARGECFRVYDSPEESFRDHSDFLRYRDRYKF
ncbi:MAG: glucosaminidase domain-containing protein, partial [Bacteroidales bacterium]|nr:glucosaminidase domain-containing protein [Bacteroidales bacterium]